MKTAVLRDSGCERGGRAAILVQYESIFIEFADSLRGQTHTHKPRKGMRGRRSLHSKSKATHAQRNTVTAHRSR